MYVLGHLGYSERLKTRERKLKQQIDVFPSDEEHRVEHATISSCRGDTRGHSSACVTTSMQQGSHRQTLTGDILPTGPASGSRPQELRRDNGTFQVLWNKSLLTPFLAAARLPGTPECSRYCPHNTVYLSICQHGPQGG